MNNIFKKIFSIELIVATLSILLIYAYSLEFKTKDLQTSSGYSIVQYGVLDNYKYVIPYTDKAFDHLPQKLLSKFFEDKGVLYHESEMTYQSKKWSAGCFTHEAGYPIIAIRTDKKSDNGIPITICHEFGHYLDYKIGYITTNDEWKKIADEERKNMYRYNDYYDNYAEYFAQSFAYYCFKDSSCYTISKANCPKTIDYIDKIVTSFIKADNI